MAQIELLEQHGRDAPGAKRPRGRGAKQAGSHDRDVHPLHGRDDSRALRPSGGRDAEPAAGAVGGPAGATG